MENINNIIEENSRLIYSVVNLFKNNNNKDDLYQAGVLGMIKAYKNFDNSINVKFTTYAYPYILGEVKKFLREDKDIKISRSISKFNYQIEKVSILLSQKLYREPTTKEIADFLNIDELYVIDSINSKREVKSIDEPIMSDSKEITLHETIPSKQEKIDDLIMLRDEIEKLNNFEKEIIQKRYFEDETQTEIASLLGMTQVQVSRREQKILAKLKQKLY
ncbi:MAG TPA: sigma-70 family RNA polymerase sigma factor [Bacilli bacterium]|nr:sigma-70 family RNA polymerase sigma factor [Bacilli bacterium]